MLNLFQNFFLFPLVFANVMDDFLRGEKQFEYDYYDDIIFPAKMGKESIRGSSEGPVDLCNLRPPYPMFCKCSDEEMDVTCFVYTETAPNDMVWDLFGDKTSIAKLRFISRPEESLTFVPFHVFEHLPNLQTLSFSHGRINVVPSFAFDRLVRLVGIDLSSNKIFSLEEKSFAHLHNLVELVLKENFLSHLKVATFFDLPRLRILVLDRNNITLIDDGVFSDMPDLTELELWGNGLTEVNPQTFTGLGNLRHLDLSSNHIKIIPSHLFHHTPKLQEIRLDHNSIETIEDDAFDGLVHLLRLQMASNQLTSIADPSPFVHLPRLMMLNLRENQLTTLSSKAILSLANVHNTSAYIHIEGNPFQCSCDLIWMVTFINTSELTPLRDELSTIKCTPPSKTDTRLTLVQVPWQQLGCVPAKSTTTISYKYEIASTTTQDVENVTSKLSPTIPQSKQESSSIQMEKTNNSVSMSASSYQTCPIYFLVVFLLVLSNKRF